MEFTLFLEAGDIRNEDIQKELHSVFGERFESVVCPPGTSSWYNTPFVRDSNGRAYFGIESIHAFVEEKHKNGAM